MPVLSCKNKGSWRKKSHHKIDKYQHKIIQTKEGKYTNRY
jgi:hypothetical protein